MVVSLILGYNIIDYKLVKMKLYGVSLAVAALLGYVNALNVKAYSGTGDMAFEFNAADVYSQEGRFINAKGEPIVLS